PAFQIQTMDAGEAIVLRPHLAVDVRGLRAHHVHLRRVDVLLRRQLPLRELLRLAIELQDRRLVHVAEPEIAVLVAAQAEEAGGESGLRYSAVERSTCTR